MDYSTQKEKDAKAGQEKILREAVGSFTGVAYYVQNNFNVCNWR